MFDGRAMAQTLREYPGNVIAHVDGVAASAATFLCCAADTVSMAKGSMLMIHNAWTIAAGNADDLLQSAALLEKIDGQIANDYAAKAGVTPEQARAWMDAETWFTESEAVESKLANEIAGDGGEKALAAWDMRAYAKAPKVENVAQEAKEILIDITSMDSVIPESMSVPDPNEAAHADASRRFALIETNA